VPCPDWEAKTGPSTSLPPGVEEEAALRHQQLVEDQAVPQKQPQPQQPPERHAGQQRTAVQKPIRMMRKKPEGEDALKRQPQAWK